METTAPVSHARPPLAKLSDQDQEIMIAAKALEASFLAEMLKSAGFGESRESFGGGLGEDQFASFLRTEHARAMAENGGIGLAESIFHVLKEQQNATTQPE